MESIVPPPKELSWSEDPAGEWTSFKERFLTYLEAIGAEDLYSEKRRYAIFKMTLGERGLYILNSLPGEFITIKEAIKALDGYFLPQKNVNYERYKFFISSQTESETIDEYLTRLRSQAKKCEFGPLSDGLILARLISGLSDESLRTRLLLEKNITLDEAIGKCKAVIASRERNKEISGKEVLYVKPKAPSVETKGKFVASAAKPSIKDCKFCGLSHLAGKCPAYGKLCSRCGKKNHFARKCKQSEVNVVDHEDQASDSDDVSVHRVFSTGDNLESDWKVKLNVEGKSITFKIDTGAQVNVIPQKMASRLGVTCRKSEKRLATYSGGKLTVIGTCNLSCSYKGRVKRLEFEVVDTPFTVALLGLKSSVAMGLIARIDAITKENIASLYPRLFGGFGKLSGKCHITIDPSATPVVHAPRRIPFAVQDKVKRELKRMEKEGVIEPVSEPTDWVSPLVVAYKPNGDVRLCIDPKDLNKAIKREHFQLPTVDEIASDLHGARYFSSLDATSGFWHMELDEESSKLCTFITPWGRFKFLRLPFGVSCAPEKFHKRYKEAFAGLDGVKTFIDDLLVFGYTREEHDRNLESVLKRAEAEGIKFNLEKCKIGLTEITYLGHKFSAEGISPDTKKVEAIVGMPRPANRKDLERFLGLVNYMGKFIKGLATIAQPLRLLLQKEVAWHWEDVQEQAWDRLKTAITTAPVLAYYDPSRPITISVDASQTGLGAVLFQDGHPVAYASKTLTGTEQRYANIEKELYAVVFGCERFHMYSYGKPFVVESDHKPLEAIFQKPLYSCPPRLQRMMLRLQRYSVSLRYIPGKYMTVSDALSRAPLKNQHDMDYFSKELESYVLAIVKNLPVCDDTLTRLKEETKKDEELQAVMGWLAEGCPDNNFNSFVEKYKFLRDELSVHEGLVFKGQQIVIPRSLRKEMLGKIHYAHQGRDKCLQRARDAVYWPGMQNEICLLVGKCNVCLKFRNSKPKEPMLLAEIPEGPWQKVAMDIFTWKGIDWLIIVDYFSKFCEYSRLPNITSRTIICEVKKVFARHGIPLEVIADQGTQFSSSLFLEFAKSWGFKRTLVSPKYQQANGQAERSVQTIKKSLKKCLDSEKDPYLCLLELNNTPSTDLPAPAELLMSRKLRGVIPRTQELLKPQVTDLEKTKAALRKRQELSKKYYDRGSRKVEGFCPGEEVVFQKSPGSSWTPGAIKEVLDRPRSYRLVAEDGGVVERNQRHILPAGREERGDEEDAVQGAGDGGGREEDPRTPGIYRTRSGRAVRPPTRLNL